MLVGYIQLSIHSLFHTGALAIIIYLMLLVHFHVFQVFVKDLMTCRVKMCKNAENQTLFHSTQGFEEVWRMFGSNM